MAIAKIAPGQDADRLDRHRRDGLEHVRSPADRRLLGHRIQSHAATEPERCSTEERAGPTRPRAVAEASDVVFTIVGFPADVRSVMLGARRRTGRQPTRA